MNILQTPLYLCKSRYASFCTNRVSFLFSLTFRFADYNISILGSSSIGASEAKELKMETKQLRPNVYEITVSGPAGEYCIMPMINGAGGYSGVFDFTIK
ncbi:MAG: hypothetical protein RR182_06745 [Alistipes sp.]